MVLSLLITLPAIFQDFVISLVLQLMFWGHYLLALLLFNWAVLQCLLRLFLAGADFAYLKATHAYCWSKHCKKRLCEENDNFSMVKKSNIVYHTCYVSYLHHCLFQDTRYGRENCSGTSECPTDTTIQLSKLQYGFHRLLPLVYNSAHPGNPGVLWPWGLPELRFRSTGSGTSKPLFWLGNQCINQVNMLTSQWNMILIGSHSPDPWTPMW